MNKLEVRCYSGYTYAERPASFRWHGTEYEVDRIERSWLEPGERCFEVHTRDKKTFKLCYNETIKKWSLTEAKPPQWGGEEAPEC